MTVTIAIVTFQMYLNYCSTTYLGVSTSKNTCTSSWRNSNIYFVDFYLWTLSSSPSFELIILTNIKYLLRCHVLNSLISLNIHKLHNWPVRLLWLARLLCLSRAQRKIHKKDITNQWNSCVLAGHKGKMTKKGRLVHITSNVLIGVSPTK